MEFVLDIYEVNITGCLTRIFMNQIDVSRYASIGWNDFVCYKVLWGILAKAVACNESGNPATY